MPEECLKKLGMSEERYFGKDKGGCIYYVVHAFTNGEVKHFLRSRGGEEFFLHRSKGGSMHFYRWLGGQHKL